MNIGRITALDLDGTLIDSMPALEDVCVDVLRGHGRDEAYLRAAYRSTSGRPFAEQAAMILPGWGLRDEVYRFELAKAALYDTVELFPRTEAALDELAANSFLAIASSTTLELTVKVARRLGLDREMDFIGLGTKDDIVSSCDVFYGDSVHDAEIAADYGVRFVRVGEGGLARALGI